MPRSTQGLNAAWLRPWTPNSSAVTRHQVGSVSTPAFPADLLRPCTYKEGDVGEGREVGAASKLSVDSLYTRDWETPVVRGLNGSREGDPSCLCPELLEASLSLSAKSSEKAPRPHGYSSGPADRTQFPSSY